MWGNWQHNGTTLSSQFILSTYMFHYCTLKFFSSFPAVEKVTLQNGVLLCYSTTKPFWLMKVPCLQAPLLHSGEPPQEPQFINQQRDSCIHLNALQSQMGLRSHVAAMNSAVWEWKGSSVENTGEFCRGGTGKYDQITLSSFMFVSHYLQSAQDP